MLAGATRQLGSTINIIPGQDLYESAESCDEPVTIR
jgi:hypothetical protein